MLKHSLLAGLAGATALTLIHQTARLITPHAPRMDILGQRALRPMVERLGFHPDSTTMQGLALAGDLIANSLYYAAVGAGHSQGIPSRGWAAAAFLHKLQPYGSQRKAA